MMHARKQFRAAAALLAVAGTCLAALVGSAGAAQDGLNVTFGLPGQNAHIQSVIDRLHPTWIRVFVQWNEVEPAAGSYDTALLENAKAFFAALPSGTKIDVVLADTPSWAGANAASPPSNDHAFGAFANYVANAFGPSVTAYEIWNEEDSSSNWSGTPADYAGLLEAAYPAIKSANPNATVMLGGLGANDYLYLQQLYQAGAGHSFDAVGVHTDDACSITSPYAFAYNPHTTQINRWSFLGFTTVHDVMAANGDGAKPIYMTELGWSTTQATCSAGSSAGKRAGGVSDRTQAKYLREAYHCLAQPQYSYVAAAMWFDMADFGKPDNFYNRYGLLSYGLSPKPAFTAFATESARGDTLNGGCGNFAGPRLRMSNPYNGEHYKGPLQIAVSARRNGKARGDAVGQIELSSDGKRIMYINKVDAHYSHGVLSGSIDWQGAKYLAPGPHVITATVNNANGVTSTLKVTVIHV